MRVIKLGQMRWAGYVDWIGGERCVEGFGGKTLRERDHLVKPRVWEYNIKMDRQEVGCWVYGLDWAGSG